MDRTLQSGLEKRTRVGAWSSRVYRLERGYLSAWTDVSRVAAKEEPSRTECLFEGNQVAKLTDQGDRRFKLDFPWDSSRSLQLRASNLAMKKAWMDVLKATLKEISAQIQGTGAVFAYGGAAHYEEDQAYEEATFLRTNRFMAAYVIDEESRMSYIHDVLNEGFHQAERSGSGREIHRACVGANSAVDELLALVRDFHEEMQGLDELQGGGGSARDAAVLAPKIRRFCEQHLKLVGRLVTSRLMLELSPFMDSSMIATSSGGLASPSRQELVATRRKLDEAYTVAQRHAVMGTRDWLMDIRGSLLDCEGLAAASSPTSNTEMTRSAEASVAVTENRVSQMNLGPGLLSARRANQDAPSVSSSVGGVENSGVGGMVQETVSQSSRRLVQSFFRRGSRSEKEQPLASSPQAAAVKGGQGETSMERSTNTEERQKSDLFGGSSKSAGESPLPKIDAVGRSSVLPDGEEPVNTASTTSTSLSPQLQKAESGRKTRRAFAGGLWSRAGDSVPKGDPRVNHPYPRESATREATTTTTAVEQTSPPPVVDAVAGASRSDVAAVKPSGGKRRFAGGVFSEPAATASSRGTQSGTNDPSFAAAIHDIPAARDEERSPNPTAESVPAWATEGGNGIPSWATDSNSKANGLSSGRDGAHPDGFEVAPPSRVDQGQQAAGKSPFMKAEAPAPAVRRPSQKPGESGRAKRAFGGGKSLF